MKQRKHYSALDNLQREFAKREAQIKEAAVFWSGERSQGELTLR